jgi:hypothetical protein
MRAFRTRELAPLRDGVRDVGVVVVSEVGHKTLRCRRTTLHIRREDEPDVDPALLKCEACGRPIAVTQVVRAIAAISSSGVLGYQVLETVDGSERPVGPWRYVPVGAWR